VTERTDPGERVRGEGWGGGGCNEQRSVYPHKAGSTARGLYLLHASAGALYRIRGRRLTCALISCETKQKLASIHLLGDDFFVGARCVVSLHTARSEEELGGGSTRADAVESVC
jgi:hypothetical protein